MTYQLPISGDAPNQVASRGDHEQAVNDAIEARALLSAGSSLIALGSTSGADTITAAIPSAFTGVSITTGTAVLLKPVASNTGPVTLDVGNGPAPVQDGDGAALEAGALRQNHPVLLRYSTSGGGRWRMVSNGMTRAEFEALSQAVWDAIIAGLPEEEFEARLAQIAEQADIASNAAVVSTTARDQAVLAADASFARSPVYETVQDGLDAASWPGCQIPPEQFGARSGLLLDAYAREIVDDLLGASQAVSAQYAWLLDQTFRRFMRAGVWDDTDWSRTVGIISFAYTGSDPVREVAFNWIADRYYSALTGIDLLGDPVTSAALDAAEAIDPAENWQAMQAWADALAGGNDTGVMRAAVYPVDRPIRIRDRQHIRGVPGWSTIRMDGSINTNDEERSRPVIWSGDIDEPADGLNIYGVSADYNWRRWGTVNDVSANSGSGVTTPRSYDRRGAAWSLGYTRDSRFVRIAGYDAYKHCCDISGATDARDWDWSGDPWDSVRTARNYGGDAGDPSYPAREQIAARCHFEDCEFEGAGDDCWTNHNCDDISCTRVFGRFARTTFTTNSNGLEADDAANRTTLTDCGAAFCFSGLEAKGHANALPADDTIVRGTFLAEYCNTGVNIRHVGHGQTVSVEGDDDDEPTTAVVPIPIPASVKLGTVIHRHPLRWSSGVTRKALTHQAYPTVTVGTLIAEQAGGASDHYGAPDDPELTQSMAVIAHFRQAGLLDIGTVIVDGFDETARALRITNSSIGPVMIGKVIGRNGPGQRFVQHTASACDLFIGAHDIRRDSVFPDGIAINSTFPERVTIGLGVIENYDRDTLVSPTPHRFFTDADDLFDLRLDGPANQVIDGMWFSSSVPDNGPDGVTVATFEFRQRGRTSAEFRVYETASPGREFRNRYSGGSWQGWQQLHDENGVFGWGTQSSTTFTGSLNDLLTDYPSGVYITSTSTTDGPDAGTNVFEVLNLPRLDGTRGSQMAFASPGAGSDRVFTRGLGSGGFTPWVEVFTTARAIPPGPFADDAAAASGGVPVGSIYRVTDGTVAWRQA